jgi:hypothetical protein
LIFFSQLPSCFSFFSFSLFLGIFDIIIMVHLIHQFLKSFIVHFFWYTVKSLPFSLFEPIVAPIIFFRWSLSLILFWFFIIVFIFNFWYFLKLVNLLMNFPLNFFLFKTFQLSLNLIFGSFWELDFYLAILSLKGWLVRDLISLLIFILLV